MRLIAINEIEYLDANGSRAYAQPNHPFAVGDTQGEGLKNMGAARDLTEAETALEEMRSRNAASSRTPSAKPAGKASKPAPDGEGADDGGDGEGADDDSDSDDGEAQDAQPPKASKPAKAGKSKDDNLV